MGGGNVSNKWANMGHILTALLLGGIVIAAFRFFKIPVTLKTVSLAMTGIGMMALGGYLTLIFWQGAAPLSHQIVLTRFIVALNPDLKALIKTINVGIGDRVSKGDVLFELDKLQFQAPVDQYAADLAAQKAQVDSLQAAVELSKATIKRVEAQASTTDANRVAAQTLLARGSPAASKLKVMRLTRTDEAADASVLEAKASQREAVFALAAGRATVKSVQGLLDKAKSDLDRTTYRAPADGVMINWQARPGTITATLRASAVGTFMETGNPRIIIVLPQNLLRNVAVGDTVEFAFLSRPGEIDTGKIIRIANYSGEGQLAAGGDVVVMANIRSKGSFALVATLDDVELSQGLGLGAAGTAAVYTQSGRLFHMFSSAYIRLVSLFYYLP